MAAEVRADANLCIGAVRGELQSRVCGNRARARHPNPSQLWPPSSWPGAALVYSLRLCPQVVKYHPGDND